ncbi:hypothetical protein DSL72_000752 [Monilinia vaccinii-corymbosi]|uniref:Uncharacterized protein n=1 Tax=Monilinia vaccinii-corymbosi TaxID=61207 RepID=A0A8A3P9R2_9HELO|nr:hypothetical protein DSL72_000752 [Monilinia vaccinii-corymbosi]
MDPHGQEPGPEPQLSGNFAFDGSGADLKMKIPQADILRVLGGVLPATPDDLDLTWGMVYHALFRDKLPGPLCTAARSAQGFVAAALCSLVKDGPDRGTVPSPRLASRWTKRQQERCHPLTPSRPGLQAGFWLVRAGTGRSTFNQPPILLLQHITSMYAVRWSGAPGEKQ